jgi:cytochrome c553
MKRNVKIGVLFGVVMVFGLMSALTSEPAQGQGKSKGGGLGAEELRRIQKGFDITPVPLTNIKGKDRNLVGLGSYIVNAVAACGDCHTCPTYAPGHNPFQGGDGQINAANFLAGGVPFGPIVSANITPDETGKPAGLTFEEYLELIRTGHDPDEPGEILQVMPWPIFRNMNDRDIHAIYEYLSAIPHAEPGACSGPGQ